MDWSATTIASAGYVVRDSGVLAMVRGHKAVVSLLVVWTAALSSVEPILHVCPLDLAEIRSITPLGNFNPRGSMNGKPSTFTSAEGTVWLGLGKYHGREISLSQDSD